MRDACQALSGRGPRLPSTIGISCECLLSQPRQGELSDPSQLHNIAANRTMLSPCWRARLSPSPAVSSGRLQGADSRCRGVGPLAQYQDPVHYHSFDIRRYRLSQRADPHCTIRHLRTRGRTRRMNRSGLRSNSPGNPADSASKSQTPFHSAWSMASAALHDPRQDVTVYITSSYGCMSRTSLTTCS